MPACGLRRDGRMNPAASPRSEEPADLISGVLHDARELASAEVDKLKAEAKHVGAAAKVTGIGLAILAVAAMLLGQAIGFGLIAAGVPAWGAFAIVAAMFAIIGAIVIKRPS